MITVKFFIKNPKEHRNTVLVRIREGRRLDIVSATDEYVNLDDWDAGNGSCLTKIEEFKNGKMIQSRSGDTKERIVNNIKVNRRLETLAESIEESFKISDKSTIDKAWLKKVIFPERFIEESPIEPDLLTSARDYLADKEREWAKGSVKESVVKKTRSIIKIIERYVAYERISAPLLTEIDKSFYSDFDNYCLEVEGYQPTYSGRVFKSIKTIAFHAAANGVAINEGMRHIKIKLQRRPFPVLSFDELTKIEQHDFKSSSLDNVRDWLIIGAFCGQRCSDFLRFDRSMLERETNDGKETVYVCFTQKKTNKKMRLALHQKIVQILNKRAGDFPTQLSDQRFNEYIKKVAEKAGIDEMTEGGISKKDAKGRVRKIFGIYPKHMLLTSHTCRRSFCSNFYGIIETSILMLASGHTTEKQFREYIHDVDRKQAERFAQAISSVTITLN